MLTKWISPQLDTTGVMRAVPPYDSPLPPGTRGERYRKGNTMAMLMYLVNSMPARRQVGNFSGLARGSGSWPRRRPGVPAWALLADVAAPRPGAWMPRQHPRYSRHGVFPSGPMNERGAPLRQSPRDGRVRCDATRFRRFVEGHKCPRGVGKYQTSVPGGTSAFVIGDGSEIGINETGGRRLIISISLMLL